MPIIRDLQLGKQGLTKSFIENLKNSFKKSRNIKISVLKSAREDGRQGKQQVKDYANKLTQELGDNYSIRTIGFTICIKKIRAK